MRLVDPEGTAIVALVAWDYANVTRLPDAAAIHARTAEVARQLGVTEVIPGDGRDASAWLDATLDRLRDRSTIIVLVTGHGFLHDNRPYLMLPEWTGPARGGRRAIPVEELVDQLGRAAQRPDCQVYAFTDCCLNHARGFQPASLGLHQPDAHAPAWTIVHSTKPGLEAAPDDAFAHEVLSMLVASGRRMDALGPYRVDAWSIKDEVSQRLRRRREVGRRFEPWTLVRGDARPLLVAEDVEVEVDVVGRWQLLGAGGEVIREGERGGRVWIPEGRYDLVAGERERRAEITRGTRRIGR